jgi:hypothetical protein
VAVHGGEGGQLPGCAADARQQRAGDDPMSCFASIPTCRSQVAATMASRLTTSGCACSSQLMPRTRRAPPAAAPQPGTPSCRDRGCGTWRRSRASGPRQRFSWRPARRTRLPGASTGWRVQAVHGRRPLRRAALLAGAAGSRLRRPGLQCQPGPVPLHSRQDTQPWSLSRPCRRPQHEDFPPGSALRELRLTSCVVRADLVADLAPAVGRLCVLHLVR